MVIMGMMVCYIEDREGEKILAQLTLLVIQWGVVLTMLRKNSFSRKLVVFWFICSGTELIFVKFYFGCILQFCLLSVILFFILKGSSMVSRSC